MVAAELIPEHRLLSDSEARKAAKEFNISLDKFPKILESDPQCQKLGAKAGKLVLIERKEPMGNYNAYRYVVKG